MPDAIVQAHEALARVAAEVVETDMKAAQEMIRAGTPPPAEAMALTTRLREALLRYQMVVRTARSVQLAELIAGAYAALDADAPAKKYLEAAIRLWDYADTPPDDPEVPTAKTLQ